MPLYGGWSVSFDGGKQVSELSLGEYHDLFDILGKLFRKLDESTRSYYLYFLLGLSLASSGTVVTESKAQR